MNIENIGRVMTHVLVNYLADSLLLLKVHNFTDVCWANCVDRFIDTTLSITNRFTQMVSKV
uniref:Mitochondrial import inner membrane translocase subunit n=1 Tax=Hucho hucho TaxID=62062 RepID=A0A4W5Q3B3_9TELE